MKGQALAVATVLGLCGCVPALMREMRTPNTQVPDSFNGSTDTSSSAQKTFSEFFNDPNLVALIDTALKNNQELNVVSLEVEIAGNEILARQGEFLPQVNARVGAGIDKVGAFTSQGVSDEAHEVPVHLPNFGFGLFASWEIDVWGKLCNATKAATLRYLSSVEGRKFTVTVLIAELASSYYELLALDAELEVLKENTALQKDALENVRLQKQAARVTELAVKRFEAEVLKNQGRQYGVAQRIVATENKINFLVGRFPQHVDRTSQGFVNQVPAAIAVGLPTQILENRPDVKQAELALAAAELDVKVARASFFPSLGLSAGLGAQSFDFLKLVTTPASLLYGLSSDITAPLFNRKVLTANYFTANSKQLQAVFNYERAILKGIAEAGTQLAALENLQKSYELKAQAVAVLNESNQISSLLFTSARADYVEVLLTRRESLEAQLELIETKQQQFHAVVSLYQALGGGWR